MSAQHPLASHKLMAFVGTQDPVKAKKFYSGVLGLPLAYEDNFAQAYEVQGVLLRVTKVEKVAVAPYTVLGWQVADIATTGKALLQAGVRFERYPRLEQNELAIWNAPGGAKVAWFKDPDGNTLSIAQL
jgi:catechol 2,3-dioxygenase-like lactoylglutathione lyase family enzyme